MVDMGDRERFYTRWLVVDHNDQGRTDRSASVAPAATRPNDTITDAQSSESQGFREPTLRLPQNNGSNIWPPKSETRKFEGVDGKVSLTEVDPVQTFKVRPFVVCSPPSLTPGMGIRRSSSSRNSWKTGNDLRI